MFLINGESADSLPVTDRGLQYGDGVFETIAVYQKKLLCWEQHYQRLVRGCQRLDISSPSGDLLFQEVKQLIKNDQNAVLKVIVTRGRGGRGYRPPLPAPEPTRIVGCYPWPDYPSSHVTEGVKLRFCEMRMGRNPALAGIKHLNRLEQVMARNEWEDSSIAEGLMLDTSDSVISGTMSNLFVVKNNKLLTSLLEHCGIKGIIRQAVLDLAESLSINTVVTSISKNELLEADALFLTNSIFGIWPVQQLEDRQFKDHDTTHRIRQALIKDKIIAP